MWSDATFALPEGSFTAVLGPNGAGKSTLLRLALGLLAPSSGSIEVFGGPPRRGSSGIGYVAQQTSFDPELSIRGREFVRLGLDGHRWGLPLPGRPAARACRLVHQVLEAVSALSYADRPIGRLSGGEQQRLRLAQALVGDPKILLLDEPLSHLDIGLQGAMVQLIADVARTRRLTVVLIAHDVNPLLRYTDQVVYVAHGRVAVGAPSEVITSEALSRIYGAPVEVLRDSRGRVFVVGLEEEVSHPHYD